MVECPLCRPSVTATDLESPLSLLGVHSDRQGSGDSDGSSETDVFLPVINAIDLDALDSIALEVRLKRDRCDTSAAKQSLQNLTCSAQTPPRTGSFNDIYGIMFSDEVK